MSFRNVEEMLSEILSRLERIEIRIANLSCHLGRHGETEAKEEEEGKIYLYCSDCGQLLGVVEKETFKRLMTIIERSRKNEGQSS